jgi:hypothetical protein
VKGEIGFPQQQGGTLEGEPQGLRTAKEAPARPHTQYSRYKKKWNKKNKQKNNRDQISFRVAGYIGQVYTIQNRNRKSNKVML